MLSELAMLRLTGMTLRYKLDAVTPKSTPVKLLGYHFVQLLPMTVRCPIIMPQKIPLF